MDGKDAFVSWSGGKDSCLALHRARSQGLMTVALLNMLDAEGKRSHSHGLSPGMVASQALALGTELIQPRASWEEYEAEFKRACATLAGRGVTHAVFGAIGVDEHREWVERVCRECGLKAHLPLWGEAPRELLQEFLGVGFRAVIVSVDLSRLDESFIGRELDRSAADELLRSGVDPSGEKGEYHTVVLSGPGFSFPVEIVRAYKRFSSGRGCLEIIQWNKGTGT